MMKPYQHYIVMGVSGCGKSTVAQALAERLSHTYLEGDEFHPPQNIEKMASGHPLNDDDRQGWLTELNHRLQNASESIVLSCSALKQDYRDILTTNIETSRFIYLRGDFATIDKRMEQRKGHFFSGSTLLQNQFDTLEEPQGETVITVDIGPSTEEIIDNIVAHIMHTEN